MPFATMNDVQPKPVRTNLGPAPITEAPGDMEWSRSASMSYYAAERPSALMGMGDLGNLAMLSDYELDRLDKLPKSLVRVLAEEAQDPDFVTQYLIPALHAPNPYRKITDDIAEAVVSDETGVGDLGKSFFKKVVKTIRNTNKKIIQVNRKIAKKILPKAIYRAGSKVGAVGKKVWHRYGNVIIGIAGAVLSPFTGGASLAAASVLIAAKTMYDKKKAADEAKKLAKKDAAQIQAEADNQAAQLQAQVDKFYADNQAWFLQYEMTPDKWAKLTLDQKIEFINAGAEGRLPSGAQQVPDPQPSAPVSSDVPSSTMPPGPIAPPPVTQGPTTGGSYSGPADGASYGGGGGGGGGTQYGPPPADPSAGPQDAPAPAQDQGPAGTYELIVEGQSVGTFSDLTAATKAAIANTQPGDRFEVMFNGQSTGLRIRTATSTVAAPEGQEDKIRQMTHEQVVALVAKADKGSSGGIPWGLIAIAGGGLLALSGK